MIEGTTILITFLFVAFLISIIVGLTIYELRENERDSMKQQIIGVQEKFMALVNKINSHLSEKYKINADYHKGELLSILQQVDKDIISTEVYTNKSLGVLLKNRDLIVSNFLNWSMIYNTSNKIILAKETQHLLKNRLISEFNSACSKYTHINVKYKSQIGYLNFISDRNFYETVYFDKMTYLIELSYTSLSEGNFIKSFNLKVAYDELEKELFKVLKTPAEFLQQIHDSKYEIQVLETELSNHIKDKRYTKILAKLDPKKVKDSTYEKFNKLKNERQNYFSTLRWSDDTFAKHNNLKKMKMMMINLDNQIDADIREHDEERLKELQNSSKRDIKSIVEENNLKQKLYGSKPPKVVQNLSRAANVLEAEAKLIGSYRDIFDDIFNVQ